MKGLELGKQETVQCQGVRTQCKLSTVKLVGHQGVKMDSPVESVWETAFNSNFKD